MMLWSRPAATMHHHRSAVIKNSLQLQSSVKKTAICRGCNLRLPVRSNFDVGPIRADLQQQHVSIYCKMCSKSRDVAAEDVPSHWKFRSCTHCRSLLPIAYNFSQTTVTNRNRRFFKTTCKSCCSTQSKILKGIKKRIPLPKEYRVNCGICQTLLTRKNGKKVMYDHCHNTGAFRGFLCRSCNTSLGKFKDDRELLLKAVDYLDTARRLYDKTALSKDRAHDNVREKNL